MIQHLDKPILLSSGLYAIWSDIRFNSKQVITIDNKSYKINLSEKFYSLGRMYVHIAEEIPNSLGFIMEKI